MDRDIGRTPMMLLGFVIAIALTSLFGLWPLLAFFGALAMLAAAAKLLESIAK